MEEVNNIQFLGLILCQIFFLIMLLVERDYSKLLETVRHRGHGQWQLVPTKERFFGYVNVSQGAAGFE